MDAEEFRKACKQVASFIVNHRLNIGSADIYPHSEPGDMKKKLPLKPPEKKENFSDIFQDVEAYIVPYLLNWHHPQFYAYFSLGCSYPGILAEMLITGLATMGHSWASCPALTELELMVLDMYGRLLHIPSPLLFEESDRKGGGSLHNSASEGIYVAMLTARNRALKILQKQKGGHHMDHLKTLVAYTSKEAHSCVKKAARVQQVPIRRVRVTDEDHSMTAETLEKLIEGDIANGRYPFFVVGCIGTTGTAAIDDLIGISKIIKKHPEIWYHIDAAYGGMALMLPEFHHLLPGIENIDSMNVNPYKWGLTPTDGAALWVKDRMLIAKTLKNDMKYFSHEKGCASNLSTQSISYTRRFRCLRLWFVLRVYGKKRIQAYLRNHISLCQRAVRYIEREPTIQLVGPHHFGMSCFRMKKAGNKPANDLTRELMNRLNKTKKIYVIPHEIKGYVIIRFCVAYEHATEKTLYEGWKMVRNMARELARDPVITKSSPDHDFIVETDKPKTGRLSFGIIPIQKSKESHIEKTASEDSTSDYSSTDEN